MKIIRNINEFAESLLCDSVEELEKHFSEEIYPVKLFQTETGVTLSTDADGVPFYKTLVFPFDASDYEDAIVGLQCVTDYAMHEGYDETHKEMFQDLALRHAEKIGVYEYKVNGSFMEYWSLYDEGFYFFRTDLRTMEREQVCLLPWEKGNGHPVPAFLKTPEGCTKYNYFCG